MFKFEEISQKCGGTFEKGLGLTDISKISCCVKLWESVEIVVKSMNIQNNYDWNKIKTNS